jgi:Flp pilus assembly protein TadD
MKQPLCFALAVLCLTIGLAGQVSACFYSTYALNTTDNTQTSLEDILLDRLAEADKARGGASYYARELAKLEKELPQRRRDPAFLRDYGYILHVTGNTPRAIAIWEEALKLAPEDYALLCNLATAHQILGRDHFATARTLLEKAVKLKPGFRHGAEELHLRLLDHLQKQSQDENYIKRELMLPELTPAWKARKDPPNRFQAAGVGKETIKGLTELLRQFPKQADTWMVLGMLLESAGEWREARLAYQKALKFGCGMSDDLHDYFEKYRAFAERKNPVRMVGWLFLGVFLLMIGALIGPRVLATVRGVVEDVQEVSRRRNVGESRGRASRGSPPPKGKR